MRRADTAGLAWARRATVLYVTSITMGDSSVRRLAILFDRENETYLPGELVSGKILTEFTKPKKVRGELV